MFKSLRQPLVGPQKHRSSCFPNGSARSACRGSLTEGPWPVCNEREAPMQDISYRAAPVPVRDDFAAAHTCFWKRLASPGA
jgi:hypothetical protein